MSGHMNETFLLLKIYTTTNYYKEDESNDSFVFIKSAFFNGVSFLTQDLKIYSWHSLFLNWKATVRENKCHFLIQKDDIFVRVNLQSYSFQNQNKFNFEDKKTSLFFEISPTYRKKYFISSQKENIDLASYINLALCFFDFSEIFSLETNLELIRRL